MASEMQTIIDLQVKEAIEGKTGIRKVNVQYEPTEKPFPELVTPPEKKIGFLFLKDEKVYSYHLFQLLFPKTLADPWFLQSTERWIPINEIDLKKFVVTHTLSDRFRMTSWLGPFSRSYGSVAQLIIRSKQDMEIDALVAAVKLCHEKMIENSEKIKSLDETSRKRAIDQLDSFGIQLNFFQEKKGTKRTRK